VAVPKTPDGLSDALDAVYVNARSEECWEAHPGGIHRTGLRVVTHRGELYVVVGIYLARSCNGRRALRCILERMRHTGESPGNP